MISILISSHNRLPLLENALRALDNNRPRGDFEVVIADEGSAEPIEEMLRQFDFPITFIEVSMEEFTRETGIAKYHNNPALTNNIAFKHSKGDYIFLQGNDIIACDNAYDKMMEAAIDSKSEDFFGYCTTYNVYSQELQNQINSGKTSLVKALLKIQQAVLQGPNRQSDVTNYLSICTKSLWEKLRGYDERYVAGQACEDSDFARRTRVLLKKNNYIDAETLHQYHGDITHGITASGPLYPGLLTNRKLFYNWDGGHRNSQPWEPGTLGIKRVVQL